MARVVVVFEDKEATGGSHIDMIVESTDPPLPIATVTDPRWRAELEGDEDLDVENATPRPRLLSAWPWARSAATRRPR